MFKGKLWIFLVLTSFVLLLAPKNAWHHCEEHADETHKDSKQKYVDNGACFICDFHFFAATIHAFPKFVFSKAEYQQFDFFSKDQCIVFLKHTSLRGPPAEM